MPGPVVAVLGARYADLSVEEEEFRPLDVRLVSGAGADDDDIARIAGDADVVLVGSRPRLGAAVLERLRCRGIVRSGIGTENIDVAAATRLGITVTRVSDYGTEAVAFHAVAMAASALRRLADADRTVREGGWGVACVRPLHLPSAMTAGVVGYGRIGRQVARSLAGLGFRVVAHDPHVDVDAAGGAVSATLPDLLAGSDVVTLHMPGDPGGRPLLGAAELGTMKPGSVLVNTARGTLVDTGALVSGLQAGRPAFAALDVFPTEPPNLADLGMVGLADVGERLLLSPHMAWYTEESELDLRRKSAQEAVRLLRGEEPAEPVVAPEMVR